MKKYMTADPFVGSLVPTIERHQKEGWQLTSILPAYFVVEHGRQQLEGLLVVLERELPDPPGGE
jgi:hypothetical protein